MRRVIRSYCLGVGLLCSVAFPADDLSTVTDINDNDSPNEQLAEVEASLQERLSNHFSHKNLGHDPQPQTAQALSATDEVFPIGSETAGRVRRVRLSRGVRRLLVFPRCGTHQASHPPSCCDPLRPL